jgi:hypothetical protein
MVILGFENDIESLVLCPYDAVPDIVKEQKKKRDTMGKKERVHKKGGTRTLRKC